MTQPGADDFTIRRAHDADAPVLAELARRTFSDTFASDNTPEDLATFLDATYGAELQRRELRDASLQYFVVERLGVMLAYALLREKVSAHVDDDAAIEVQRFYVDRASHGHGVAAALMAACVDAARERGARSLWLGVWERNARAIRFYERQGFVAVGTQVFVVGNDPQTDVVMLRTVAPSR